MRRISIRLVRLGFASLKEARMARLPGGMCTALGPVPPPEPQLSLLITSTITAQRARALNDAAMRLASSATSRARWDDVLSPISHLPYRTSGAFQRRFPPGGSGWDNSQCSATSWTAAWIHDISRTGRSRSPERQRDHHRRLGASACETRTPRPRSTSAFPADATGSGGAVQRGAGSSAPSTPSFGMPSVSAAIGPGDLDHPSMRVRKARNPALQGCLTWQVSRASRSRSGQAARPRKARRCEPFRSYRTVRRR